MKNTMMELMAEENIGELEDIATEILQNKKKKRILIVRPSWNCGELQVT